MFLHILLQHIFPNHSSVPNDCAIMWIAFHKMEGEFCAVVCHNVQHLGTTNDELFNSNNCFTAYPLYYKELLKGNMVLKQEYLIDPLSLSYNNMQFVFDNPQPWGYAIQQWDKKGSFYGLSPLINNVQNIKTNIKSIYDNYQKELLRQQQIIELQLKIDVCGIFWCIFLLFVSILFFIIIIIIIFTIIIIFIIVICCFCVSPWIY